MALEAEVSTIQKLRNFCNRPRQPRIQAYEHDSERQRKSMYTPPVRPPSAVAYLCNNNMHKL